MTMKSYFPTSDDFNFPDMPIDHYLPVKPYLTKEDFEEVQEETDDVENPIEEI